MEDTTATPSTLAIIGDLPHYRQDGILHGLTPLVAQFERWARLFDNVVFCSPLLAGRPPAGFSPYPFPATLHEVVAGGGNTRWAKVALLSRIPRWAWETRQVARSVDAVYVRCPTNIGGVALVSTLGVVPFRCASYTGVWRDYDREPRPYRYQRRLLASRWFTGPVAAFTPVSTSATGIHEAFSPSFDLATWAAAAPAAASRLERIGRWTAGTPLRLVAAGRLTPNKNHAVVVDALAELVRRGVDARLDVIGEGPERQRLVQQAGALGVGNRIRFHGMLDHRQALDLLEGADLHVLPTRQEGYGKVLVEGMVSGLVPVMTQSPLSAEISGDGAHGIVVEADRPDQVADAVARLLGDRARWSAMARAGRSYARTRTLEAYEASVRVMLESGWGVEFAAPGADEP